MFAPAQVSARERVGAFQGVGAAIKNNLPTFFTGARAHVDHPVGGQHDCGVVLDHHQGVARVAQALHGHNNAVHIPGVQADAWFI